MQRTALPISNRPTNDPSIEMRLPLRRFNAQILRFLQVRSPFGDYFNAIMRITPA
jgi:hypothetical protein